MVEGLHGLAVDGVLAVSGERHFENHRFAVRPAHFDLTQFVVFPQPEMRHRRVVRMKPAAGFDLPHLMTLALRPIMNGDFAPDAKPVAPVIAQFKGDAVPLGFIIHINLKRTVQGVGDDVEIAVVIDVYLSVGRTVIAVIQPKLVFSR